MQMPARMPCQPGFDRSRAMGGIVVEHGMDCTLRSTVRRNSRNSSWVCLRCVRPMTSPVATFRAAKGEVVPCRECSQAEHHGIAGRTQAEPDDGPDLVHKLGIIGGEQEVLVTMGVRPEGLPEAGNAVMRQAGPVGQGPRAPVGRIFAGAAPG